MNDGEIVAGAVASAILDAVDWPIGASVIEALLGSIKKRQTIVGMQLAEAAQSVTQYVERPMLARDRATEPLC